MNEDAEDEELSSPFDDLWRLPEHVDRGIRAYKLAKQLFDDGVLTADELRKVLNNVRGVLHLPPV